MNLFEQDAADGLERATASGGGDAALCERVAALALRLAGRRIAAYSSPFSRRDFTQCQLLACLVLRGSMGLTYRGVWDLLRASRGLRDTLGLAKTPHFTTLESFANSGDLRTLADELLAELLRELQIDRVAATGVEVAVDSTALETTNASMHFSRKQRRHNGPVVKLSVVVVCGLILPAALTASFGRSSDLTQAYELVRRASERAPITRLYADAGYESETLHVLCRDELGIASFIPPVPRTKDGTIRTRYRARMRRLPRSYKRRSHAESFFSAMKRTTGSCLRARSPRTLLTEAAFKVLGYAIRR